MTEARAKVDEFMDAYVDVSTAEIPTVDTAEDLFFQVDQHLAGRLSQELRGEIVGRWGARQRVTGGLDWQFLRTLGVDLDREVDGNSFPRVDLRYCVDATDWTPAAADVDDPAGFAGGRHAWRLAVSWSDDWFGQGIEGWRVVEREAREDQPC